MKKKVLLLILFLLLFPSLVLAKDTCDSNDIKIEEIKVEEKEGYTEELTPVSIDNNKINLNIEMYTVGESITYKIKVKNNSNNDYYFTKDSFNLNTDYLEYSLLNDSEVIKSNEEKSIQLKIMYKEKIPEDEFNENNMMSITLSDTPLNNPSTKRTIFLIPLVTFITMIMFIIRNKKLSKVLIGLILCFIPLSIKALCTVNLEIKANITINEKEAIFLPGSEVNTIMKTLAADNISTHYFSENTNIISIKYSELEPSESNKEEKNIVSTINSSYPIYMWYEEGTIYWWSEVKRPNLNENAAYMFNNMKSLTDISSLERFDTSNVASMNFLFLNDSNLINIMPLKDWNTSKVTTMKNYMWGTSISSLDTFQKWNVSNVTNLEGAFSSTKIVSLDGLENWDTSKMTNLFQVFSGCRSLKSLEAIKNWDIRNVTNMSGMFQWTAIESVGPLKNWDTSNTTSIFQMFFKTNLKNLEGLENWNVENVRYFDQGFAYISTLEDASAINDWNIQPTANFTSMFNATPTHPEFSKVLGTWSDGTFTPTP